MLEVLIAAFVFATGILGVAGLQMNSLAMLSNSSSISSAMLGANDLAERMRANPIGIFSGFYDDQTGASATDPGCGSQCSPSQLAVQDVYVVHQQLTQNLNSPVLEIKNTGDIYTIEVKWFERIGAESETKSHRVSFRPYDPSA